MQHLEQATAGDAFIVLDVNETLLDFAVLEPVDDDVKRKKPVRESYAALAKKLGASLDRL